MSNLRKMARTYPIGSLVQVGQISYSGLVKLGESFANSRGGMIGKVVGHEYLKPYEEIHRIEFGHRKIAGVLVMDYGYYWFDELTRRG